MTLIRLIRRNLVYFWKRNLFLALGIAVSAAVLTGALIVGDSVKYSLNRIVDQRLGNTTHVLKSGDRYFKSSLAERVRSEIGYPVSPLLLLDAVASSDGGQRRINNSRIIGIDNAFGEAMGLVDFYRGLSGDEVIISSNLADRLGLDTGDQLLLRIRKASLIPLNAPFVSDAENIVSLRVMVKGIADDDQLGRFNLRISQTAPFNVFISLDRLNEIMELDHRANALLFCISEDMDSEALMSVISDSWKAIDAGLKIRSNAELNLIEVTSHRVFLDDPVSERLLNDTGFIFPVITYFVNGLKSAKGLTPYSFVSTLPDNWLHNNEIIINEWLAEDLSASPGDSLVLSYYIVGPLRELTEDSSTFIVKSIVPMKGIFADQNLMPDLPGLSDAGNCRDWETGVPIELGLIRDRDEDYWDEWKGTPKAFISVSKGKELWHNRFGTYTALRFDASQTNTEHIENSFLSGIEPGDLGFQIESVRKDGYVAARNGVDFSQLFGGLSFFLLAAGILLIVLLFLLNLESRKEQLATLSAMGIKSRIIRRSVISEGMIIAIAGSLAGLALAVLYNKLVFLAMNGVWKDIIRTDMMLIDIQPKTLFVGFLVSLMVSWTVLFFPLNRFLMKHINLRRKLLKKRRILSKPVVLLVIFILSGTSGILLILFQFVLGDVVNPAIFFTAGTLFLISSVFYTAFRLGRLVLKSSGDLNLQALSRKNAIRNMTRSMTIIILFAIGTFLVISTGSNRKDLFRGAEDPSSGTGGYLYYSESTVPVLHDLNNNAVRFDYGLDGSYHIVQMRKASGDDASCLNLNKIVNPQILGVKPEELVGRFSFVTETEYLDVDSPWISLDKALPGGLIPAIADETVIKWGLGLRVGDTLIYKNAGGERMNLILIGGLAPSIFQGNVLISDTRFLENYPQSSGTEVFLVEGNMADTVMISNELQRGMRDFGWEMDLTAERLAEFNSVTNTYLSIFMVMGALGLLIGTIGLAVVLVRSILERKQEIALLRAVGFSMKRIRMIIFGEYMGLLGIGIGTGFTSSVIATLPSFISPYSDISFTSLLWILVLLILNGFLWIFLITRNTLGKLSINEALRND